MAYVNANLLTAADATLESGIGSWVAGANTTAARNTVLPEAGTYALQLTATAAGSVVATQSTRWAVTAGTVYLMRAPVGLSVAASGRTATVTVSWYSVATGGTVISTATSPAATILNATGYTSIHAVLIATAPAGATYAALTVTVAGMAAAALAHLDSLYAGVADNVAYNLLTPGDYGAEQDTGAWTVSGATLTRVGTVLRGDAGYACLRMSTTAAGSAHITSPAVPVTEGTEYTGTAWIYGAAVTTYVDILWYNASSTLLSTSTRAWTIAVATVTPLAVVGTAPAGAVTARVRLRADATASGQFLYLDSMVLGPAPNLAGSLLTYNEYSNESQTAGWTSPTATVGADPVWVDTSLVDGRRVTQVTTSGPDPVRLTFPRRVPVTPGQYYLARNYVIINKGGSAAPAITGRIVLDWYDAAGDLILADTYLTWDTATTGTTGYIGVTFTKRKRAPAGAATLQMSFDLDPVPAAGVTTFWIDKTAITPSTAIETLAVDDTLGLVTLTVLAGPDTAPGVTYTVVRLDATGATSPVRGYGGDLTRVPYVGLPIVVEDYEAPVGTKVSYIITWYNNVGAVIYWVYTDTVPAPVLPDPRTAWVKAPGLPALGMLAFLEEALPVTRAARAAAYQIVDRTHPVMVSGVRAGKVRSIKLITDTPDQTAQLDALLGTGTPLLVQVMPGYGITGNLYGTAGDTACEPVGGAHVTEAWRTSWDLTETDRPAGGLQGSAARTWTTAGTGYGTWLDVLNAYPTWASVLTGG